MTARFVTSAVSQFSSMGKLKPNAPTAAKLTNSAKSYRYLTSVVHRSNLLKNMFSKFIPKLFIALILITASCASRIAGDSNDLVVAKRIIDGDTIEVFDAAGNEYKVRLIGIDTPERNACGFVEAGMRLSALILNHEVKLITGGTDDRDRFGRLLRYVDLGDTDTGLLLIQEGFAVARFDSRDRDYPKHDRESEYIKADLGSSNFCE